MVQRKHRHLFEEKKIFQKEHSSDLQTTKLAESLRHVSMALLLQVLDEWCDRLRLRAQRNRRKEA